MLFEFPVYIGNLRFDDEYEYALFIEYDRFFELYSFRKFLENKPNSEGLLDRINSLEI